MQEAGKCSIEKFEATSQLRKIFNIFVKSAAVNVLKIEDLSKISARRFVPNFDIHLNLLILEIALNLQSNTKLTPNLYKVLLRSHCALINDVLLETALTRQETLTQVISLVLQLTFINLWY